MNRNALLLILAGFTYVAICLLPILKSGLYSDDLPNFQLKTIRADHNENAIELALPGIEEWKAKGRYTPISFILMEFAFKYFHSVFAYKTYIYLLNLLAVAVFLVYLSAIKFNVNKGIWLVCFGSVMQFRVEYHDAYTTFNGMYQMLFIFVFGSLIFYSYYLANRKHFFLGVSAIFFIISILISEVGLLTILLFPGSGLLLKIPYRKYLLSFIPYFFISLIYLSYVVWLKSHVLDQNVYTGLKTNIDLLAMTELLFKQLYATIPLTNLQNTSAISIKIFHQITDLKNLLSIIFIFFIGYLIFQRSKADQENRLKNFELNYVLLAVALMILPAFFILPSSKYQLEIGWGRGYLPVYIQNFGTATLLAYFFEYSFRNQRIANARYAISFFIFILVSTAITFLFNNALINSRSYRISFPADVLYKEVQNGILQNCREGSTIVLGNDFYWKSPDTYQALFKKITRKNFKVYDIGTNILFTDSSECYLLECKPGKMVIVSLFKMDCSQNEIKILIKQKETPCDIDVIKEDGI